MDKANNSWSYKISATYNKNVPKSYDLAQNYPNPFNSQTMITYSLSNDSEQVTRLEIIDLLGRNMRTLVNKKQTAGSYQVIWDGKDNTGNNVATGIYFYKLTSGTYSKIKKMSILK
jgi:flagellar hook assembly protein FlgD